MSILVEDKKQYEKEQTQLLKTVLNYRFFYPWKNREKYDNSDLALRNESNLELYITSQCNQKCSYCYLHKYPELYPVQFQKPELIIKNLKLLYDYILIQNYHIPILDMFSGEIWHLPLGQKILEITLDYIKQGMQVDKFILTTNGFFINDDISFYIIQDFMNKFRNIGHPLFLSFSVDGKYIDNMDRERNDGTIYTDKFYDRLLSFAKMNNCLFHPMVSSSNIHLWKENFLWWNEQLQYYNYNMNAHQALMMLEVRNDDWTSETIQLYCEFLRYLMDDFLKTSCHGNIQNFANYIGDIRNNNDERPFASYVPWTIAQADSYHGCTISNHLTVRLGDLAICPCHRTAYEQYLYGHFVVENDRITDIVATNPQMAVKILMNNLLCSSPVCSNCIYNQVCLHGCLGSQLETVKDPFFPIPSVCELFKAKHHTVLEYLREHHIIDYFKNISPAEINNDMVKKILRVNQLDEEAYQYVE